MESDKNDQYLTGKSPKSLFQICLDYIATNINKYTEFDSSCVWHNVKDEVTLPTEISERLLESYQNYYPFNDTIASIFCNPNRVKLRSIKLWNALAPDTGLNSILKHNPQELELINCTFLSHRSLDVINEHVENLVYLKIGRGTNIFSGDYRAFEERGYIFNAPNMKRISLHIKTLFFPLTALVYPFNDLTHLDLSGATQLKLLIIYDLVLKHMVHLVFHNVVWNETVLNWIILQKSLKYLDISQAQTKNGSYLNADQVLTEIITNLINLESLDISGTNLAGTGAAIEPSDGNTPCDIPGLTSRACKPLRFLGLYETHHGACRRHHLPAEVISGNANEEQIFTAITVYFERPVMLGAALNDLFYLLGSDACTQVPRALNMIVDAMNKYIDDKHIQISASASLFYIVKNRVNLGLNATQRIITAILNGMETHLTDGTLMRNGCLTLSKFSIPSDVLFEYERLVVVLIHGVTEIYHEGFVQRVAIYLLNSLACQVDERQKLYLGAKDTIKRMLYVVSDRLDTRVCDDVLELAWATMWNVTDETPENCRRFVEFDGLEYFITCLKYFPESDELLRNMMGLIGNVAEVPALRYRLMDEAFVFAFHDLLLSSSDGIEVSYNAAGILVHMASDGPEVWIVTDLPRDVVMDRVTNTINSWDINTGRYISYRSFKPMFELIKINHTVQCQHWATWAIANLTTVYPKKYCELLEFEGGIELLTELKGRPGMAECVKNLAIVAIGNCNVYKAEQHAQSLQEAHKP